ncbi:MAG: hypothetical protein WAL39_15500 [Xanthobacteraceae bacterium]
MMNPTRKQVAVSLNSVAKQRPVDDYVIEIGAEIDPEVIARQIFLFWYEEGEGYLVPLVNEDPDCLVPDDVVIRAQRGEVLGRWNIVNEYNARGSLV